MPGSDREPGIFSAVAARVKVQQMEKRPDPARQTYCGDEKAEARPVPASTVVLLRKGEGAFSVYLMRRAGKGGSFSGAFVFPGGLAEEGDRPASAEACAGLADSFDPARALNEPGLSRASAMALYQAAIRETWEEAGVLLASRKDGSPFDPGRELSEEESSSLRKQVASGRLSLDGLAERLSLVLRPDWLAPLARWITPVTEKRRWDTRFFLARFPEGQTATPDCRELSEGMWLSPREALALADRGEILLYPPTYVTLVSLARHARAGEALVAAAQNPPLPVVPQSFCDESGVGVLLPWDPEYRGPSPAWGEEPELPSRMLLTPKGFSPSFPKVAGQ